MHIEIFIELLPETIKHLVIANFADEAEGFEETNTGLKIYTKKEIFDEREILRLSKEYGFQYQLLELPSQNWNALWESNFDPVIVDDFVAVRADFHSPIESVEHEIMIMPKMSFGTGHHATTYLMMQQMRKIDFKNKSVFDFGTGTGILAIIAKKLGANNIIATDIDEWSIANAEENFTRNSISDILLIQSSLAIQGDNFDIILANINRNVLLETIPDLAKQLKCGGVLLLSGLLKEDEKAIVPLCIENDILLKGKTVKDKWISLCMNKL